MPSPWLKEVAYCSRRWGATQRTQCNPTPKATPQSCRVNHITAANQPKMDRQENWCNTHAHKHTHPTTGIQATERTPAACHMHVKSTAGYTTSTSASHDPLQSCYGHLDCALCSSARRLAGSKALRLKPCQTVLQCMATGLTKVPTSPTAYACCMPAVCAATAADTNHIRTACRPCRQAS